MYHDLLDLWKNLLLTGLRDDQSQWDWSSLGIQRSPSHRLQAYVIAKSEGIWAGGLLAQALALLGNQMQIRPKIQDGEPFRKRQVLLEWAGPAREVLALERPFLNLAAYVSGIASHTHRLVQKVQKACPTHPPRVTLTRKTLPGYRDVAIHGVLTGGGFPHRVSLAGGILIKENHIAAAGSIAKAIAGVRKVAPHGLKIEVEVRSQKEVKEAIRAHAEGLLLDNFAPDQVRAVLKEFEKSQMRPWIEVSGGITEETISDYALKGVSVISVGGLTHSVQAVDLSLLAAKAIR